MTNFLEMFIPCTESEYLEVKRLLEGMGYKVFSHLSEWTRECIGVMTYYDGYLQATVLECAERPTVTLPELRVMAKNEPIPNDDRLELRLLIQRVGIMERSIMGMETKINEIHNLLFKE